MTQEFKNFILIGVVEDTTVGLDASDVIIASSNSKELLEELIQEYYDEEQDGVRVGFESYQGNVYIVSEVRIEWVQ